MTKEHPLGHSLSDSAGKQNGTFLLFLCGDMRWQELEKKSKQTEGKGCKEGQEESKLLYLSMKAR